MLINNRKPHKHDASQTHKRLLYSTRKERECKYEGWTIGKSDESS